jgi:hypothetical protein
MESTTLERISKANSAAKRTTSAHVFTGSFDKQ